MNRREFMRRTGLGSIGLVATFLGCNEQTVPTEQNPQKITLKVGENHKIRDIVYIEYHGMPSDNSFSLNFLSRSSTNLYFPTSTEEFTLGDYKFRKQTVTPEEITIEYLGKNE